MMNEIETETRRPKELTLLLFGDTSDEIELAALDAARAFFGSTVRLEIVPGYKVHDDGDDYLFHSGKKYRARLNIRTDG